MNSLTPFTQIVLVDGDCSDNGDYSDNNSDDECDICDSVSL